MTPPAAEASPKIAFIVEGETDRLIVETLAKKIAAELPGHMQPRFVSISLSGSPRVRNMFPEINFLLRKGYDRVIVVFDTDSSDPLEIGSFVDSLKAQLIREGIADQVTLVAIKPEIEAWLFADADAVERAVGQRIQRDPQLTPKKNLSKITKMDRPTLERILAQLHPDLISQNDPSFQTFAQSLREALRPKAA